MKGQLLQLHLTKTGEVAEDAAHAYASLWCHVTALKTSGQVAMQPAEFNPKELKTDDDGVVIREGSRLFGLRIKDVYKFQNESLLRILTRNVGTPA